MLPAEGNVPKGNGPMSPLQERPSVDRTKLLVEIVVAPHCTEKESGTGAPAAEPSRNTTLSAFPSPFSSNNWTRIACGP